MAEVVDRLERHRFKVLVLVTGGVAAQTVVGFGNAVGVVLIAVGEPGAVAALAVIQVVAIQPGGGHVVDVAPDGQLGVVVAAVVIAMHVGALGGVHEVPVGGVLDDAGACAPHRSLLAAAGAGAADIGVGKVVDIIGALAHGGGELGHGQACTGNAGGQLGVVGGARIGLNVGNGILGDAAVGFLGESAGVQCQTRSQDGEQCKFGGVDHDVPLGKF